MIKNQFTIINKQTFSIYIESQYFEIENMVENREVIIITDENIFKIYNKYLTKYKTIVLKSGEQLKTLETINEIIPKLIENNIDRNSIIIGLGGGTICDITGFIASVYLRGVNFGLIPTTLLSQVDAAIGGKNGVNFGQYKNYIGTVNQPEFVIINSVFLETITYLEFKSGFGEILKYSLISDSELFENVYDNINQLNIGSSYILNDIIKQCIKIKIDVISKDVNDKGIRHILNFGHTFGHCFEIIDKIPHGIAVVKGMCVALDFSVEQGFLKQEIAEKIKNIFIQFEYDINYQITKSHIDLLIFDKKKVNLQPNSDKIFLAARISFDCPKF
ncbi:MAG: 3-dehydroquinate synthase [Bacteroidales bacterium]|jgi:3-dehydroquinate synthase|nr:3-dehydroquinate synthase [Bacteroidales bacterium]